MHMALCPYDEDGFAHQNTGPAVALDLASGRRRATGTADVGKSATLQDQKSNTIAAFAGYRMRRTRELLLLPSSSGSHMV